MGKGKIGGMNESMEGSKRKAQEEEKCQKVKEESLQKKGGEGELQTKREMDKEREKVL